MFGSEWLLLWLAILCTETLDSGRARTLIESVRWYETFGITSNLSCDSCSSFSICVSFLLSRKRSRRLRKLAICVIRRLWQLLIQQQLRVILVEKKTTSKSEKWNLSHNRVVAVTEAALTVLFFFIRKRTRSLEKLQILSYQKCDSYSSYSSCVSFLLKKNKTINLEKLDIRVKRVYLLMYIFNRFIFRKCQSVFWVPFPNTKMILAWGQWILPLQWFQQKQGLNINPSLYRLAVDIYCHQM